MDIEKLKEVSPEVRETMLGWHGSQLEKDATATPSDFYTMGMLHYELGSRLEAMRWMRKAADLGLAEAQYNVGVMHEEQNNHVEAVTWYRKAAEQGFANGQFALGGAYTNGKGVDLDYPEARKWLLKAAEQGLPDAQYILGVVYGKDTTVADHIAEAETRRWLRKAAEQGHAKAKDLLRTIGEKSENPPPPPPPEPPKNPLSYFIEAITKKYAIFSGRARRKEYWFFTLFAAIGALIIWAVAPPAITVIYALALLVPSLAISVRRLHDVGMNGWWVLIGLVPYVGAIVLLIFCCLDSQKGSNKYGGNPKG
jgi:uncharacterized membrane protein YhaH (DUF805 family)